MKALRTAYFVTKKVYKKQNIPLHVKIRHYKAMVRNVAKAITLGKHGAQQLKKERKILLKKLGPKRIGERCD